MSRRINEDFVLLKQFIEDYQIAQDQLSSEQNEKYKSMHKKLFGFLVFAAEFKEQNINSNSNIFLKKLLQILCCHFFVLYRECINLQNFNCDVE